MPEQEKKARMYGAAWCGYCNMAKDLFAEHGYEVDYRDCGEPEIVAELKEELPTAKTIPQIWIGDYYVGGYDALAALLKELAAAEAKEPKPLDPLGE